MAAMPDVTSWMREYEIDWSASSGKSFYPEFVRSVAEHGKERYVKDVTAMPPPAMVVRGWDFGIRRPAVVWAQISPARRPVFLRELCPEDIDIHSLRDLVMYLSGQIPIGDSSLQRRERALSWIIRLEEDGSGGPWFSGEHTWVDYASPEANWTSDIIGEAGELNNTEVLAERGIVLHAHSQRVSAGEAIFRRIFRDHPDGKGPWLILSPHVKRLFEALNGGLTWPKPTKLHPMPDQKGPAKDGYHDDVHDAARYALVGSVGLEDFSGSPLPLTEIHTSKYEPTRLVEQDEVFPSEEERYATGWDD